MLISSRSMDRMSGISRTEKIIPSKTQYSYALIFLYNPETKAHCCKFRRNVTQFGDPFRSVAGRPSKCPKLETGPSKK